ncbi:alpha/beta fold hydrolase [Bacillus sp. 1P06AnD]|uniref:alpha/beta fold hydrolase n=1 Tax=Bacillus sp. 1P06AnD TaxID=3132208 RepID=UPI0039A240A3
MDINEEKNVIYKETELGPLKANVYYPLSKGKYPGIILIHGGAWLTGDKEMYREWGPFLAKQGYPTIAFDYRLSTEENASFPEVTYDVQDAIAFVVKHADKWQIDVDRIILIGDSAGAHLAAYAALESIKDHSCKIRSAIGIYGVYNLPEWQQYTYSQRENDPVGQLMGTPHSIKQLKDASPYYLFQSLEKPLETDFYIIWGDNDDVVPANQSESFSLLLESKGFSVQTLVIPDKGHFWFNLFEEIEGGSLVDEPNPLVIKNILHYLKRKAPI